MKESNNIASVLDGKYDELYCGEEEAQLNKQVVQKNFENGESSQAKEEIVFTSISIPEKAASLALSYPASTDAKEHVPAKVLPSTYNPESYKCPYCTCAKAWYPTKFSRVPSFSKPRKLKTDYEKVMETYKTKQANRANEVEKKKIEYTMIMEADNKQVYQRDEEETDKAKFELINDEVGDENRELRGFCQMTNQTNEKDRFDESTSEMNGNEGGVHTRKFEHGEPSQAEGKKDFNSFSFPKKEHVPAKVLPSTYNPESFKCPYCICAKAWYPTKFSRVPSFSKAQKLKTDYEKVMETYKTKQANRANEFEKKKKIMEADNKQVPLLDEEETDEANVELTNDGAGDENRELRGFCQMANGNNEKGCSDKSTSEVNDGPGEESGQELDDE